MSLLEPQWPSAAPAKTTNSSPLQSIPRALSWLSFLTLDLEAPAVALVWQLLLVKRIVPQGELFGGLFTPAHALLLVIPVWLVYAADRTADGIRDPKLRSLTLRHQMHALLRRPLTFLWILLLIVSLELASATLAGRQWIFPIGLASAALLYLLLVQNSGMAGTWFRDSPGPKEAAIGLLFMGGVGVFPLQSAQSAAIPPNRLEMALFLISFALLCSCNCLLIRLAETAPLDRAHFLRGPKRRSQCQRTRRILTIQIGATLLLALCLRLVSDTPALSIAVLMALAGLIGAWCLRTYISVGRLRWLADLSLTTPVLLLFSAW